MMNNLDFIELDILQTLVKTELDQIELNNKKVKEQYEFELRMIIHKLEVLKRSVR